MAKRSKTTIRFEVAISFAGDNKRDKIRDIAGILKKTLGDGKVFFDEWFEAEIAGNDANDYFQNVFGKQSQLVVVCVCARYGQKPWTQDEWRAIKVFERTIRDVNSGNVKRMRLLPLRSSDGDIDGLFSTAIVPDVRDRTAEAIAKLILERLRLSKGGSLSESPKRTATTDDEFLEVAKRPYEPTESRAWYDDSRKRLQSLALEILEESPVTSIASAKPPTAVEPSPQNSIKVSRTEARFAIALSFPGEHREFVSKIADALANHFGRERIFYDEWYDHELVGVDGDLKLRKYYRDESETIVPVFSKYYEKSWCLNVEWSAIRAMLFERRSEDAVLPVALDETEIPGWEKIDFAIKWKNRSAEEIAAIIVKAYEFRRSEHGSFVEYQTSSDGDESENKENHRVDLLQQQANVILGNSTLRTWILDCNELDSNTTSEELTQLVFSVSPDVRKDDYWTAMDYVVKCADDIVVSPEASLVTVDLHRLISVIAPICFLVDDPDSIRLMIDRVTSHSMIPAGKPLIGLGVIARFLGVSVDLNGKCLEIGNDNWPTFGKRPSQKNVVSATASVPELGLDGKNIVQVVTEGLALALNASGSSAAYVDQKLEREAARGCHHCLWFGGRHHTADLEALRKAFPKLLILVSSSPNDSTINARVVTQIDELQQKFPL